MTKKEVGTTYFEAYRSIILDEGKFAFSMVTKYLYEGGNTRPDLFFKSKFGEIKYKRTFNNDQRLTLECCNNRFNINSAVGDYDISLNYLLHQHVCGLEPSDHSSWTTEGSFENSLTKVQRLRNNVCHKSWNIDSEMFIRNLFELWELFKEIFKIASLKRDMILRNAISEITNPSLRETFHLIIGDNWRILNGESEEITMVVYTAFRLAGDASYDENQRGFRSKVPLYSAALQYMRDSCDITGTSSRLTIIDRRRFIPGRHKGVNKNSHGKIEKLEEKTVSSIAIYAFKYIGIGLGIGAFINITKSLYSIYKS